MVQRIDLLGAVLRIFPERPLPPREQWHFRSALIIKLSSIGDVVHALPVPRALKDAYAGIRITWAVEEWTAPLVAGHPAVDRLVVFPAMNERPRRPTSWMRALRHAIRELRAEHYDVAIDLQGLARSAAISALSRSALRVARAGQREGAHLVSYGVPLPSARAHAVDEYLHVARSLGAAVATARFELPITDAARRSVGERLAAHGVTDGDRLIVVNPSAAQRWKQWPADRWRLVTEALGELGRVVLIGTKAQVGAHAALATDGAGKVIDVTGTTTIADVVALLARASLHVAADTGTIHIAAALGIPVVGVYGPTPPSRVGPYQHPESVVCHQEHCGRLCPGYCLRGHQCLYAVAAEEVIGRARTMFCREAPAARVAETSQAARWVSA